MGLSGICMGLAWASKWTGIYASAGLAIILFISLGKRVYEHIKLKRAQDEGVSSGNFVREIVITLAFCVVMFILVPLLIYYFSYYWHFRSNPDGLTLRKVWQLQQDMYSYHSRLVDSHFFKSPWYEWPLIVKPMWYYSADKAYGLNGMVSSISCMGNPAVWWIGLVMLIIMLIMLVTLKHPDKSLLITAIGFASQFLPWVLVPRSTFIYHYFASVPFIITATVIVIGMLASRGREYKIGAYAFAGALVCAALILFIMFYPLESGYPCTYEYALKLRWFDWYNFALQ